MNLKLTLELNGKRLFAVDPSGEAKQARSEAEAIVDRIRRVYEAARKA